MKVTQFSYKQQTGLATMFTAETEDELIFLENLRSLIENEEGILSRKSFSFDNGSMSIDIDKKQTRPRRSANGQTAHAITTARGKSKSKSTPDTTK